MWNGSGYSPLDKKTWYSNLMAGLRSEVGYIESGLEQYKDETGDPNIPDDYTGQTMTKSTWKAFEKIYEDSIECYGGESGDNIAALDSIAISTLVKLGIIEGRSDTIYDPNAAITRAAFATLFARFDESGAAAEGGFSDIANHWARESIERAAALGWINGYEDGTFRPDNAITRAEAMTMINRVLNRDPVENDDLLPDMRVWSDNRPGAWYYFAVQEATNSHEYTRPDSHEDWTEMTPDPDWERYQ